MKWILCVSALVSCVLIGTVASRSVQDGSSETAIEGLISRLNAPEVEPVAVETMLNEYESKEDKINYSFEETVPDQDASQVVEGAYSVGELAQLCQESTDNCTYDQFKFITSVGYAYNSTIPSLFKYSKYCRYTKLKKFCVDNIGEVVEKLSGSITENDKDVMGPFKENLGDIVERADNVAMQYTNWLAAPEQQAILDKKQKTKTKFSQTLKKDDKNVRKQLGEDMRKVYSDYMKQKLGGQTSVDEEKQFLADFKSSAKPYRDIYHVLLELYDEDESLGKLDGEIRDLFRFGRVADHFCRYGSRPIAKELAKKEKGDHVEQVEASEGETSARAD